MCKCPNVPMFQCSNVPMFQCSNVQMFKCSNVQRFKCSNVQMFKCSKQRGAKGGHGIRIVSSSSDFFLSLFPWSACKTDLCLMLNLLRVICSLWCDVSVMISRQHCRLSIWSKFAISVFEVILLQFYKYRIWDEQACRTNLTEWGIFSTNCVL